MENPNPIIHESSVPRRELGSLDVKEEISPEYIFELIRDIKDPEYPNTLEQLAVVCPEHIYIDPNNYVVRVEYTPTVPHCSMATLIGLCIRVQLMRSLPSLYEFDVFVRDGMHVAEDSINKQLNDKERVAAAIENPDLLSMVESCMNASL